ncbi:MAG: amidohydrolase [Chloroflexi bacterium]|nr:amidohydrolase [Chloroflexota bacterium]
MSHLNFKADAHALRDELIALRRDFHRHPELAFEEQRTAGIVAQHLTDLGLEVQRGVGQTGVVAMLEGERSGPTVLVRADMDALPIHEDTGLEFASGTAGKMHACGHDGHTAIALGVAKLLAGQRQQLAGRIKFVFQPAEEIARGAKAMVADGVLANPRPDVSLGLHLWNTLPLGQIAAAEGPVMAGSSDFKIIVQGRGGHGAIPQLAVDPVVVAAQLVTAFQSIISRNLDPLDSAVLSVTMLRAGEATNIIPETAELAGTFRFFRSSARDLIAQRLRAISAALCAALGCTAEVTIVDHTEPVINDSAVTRQVRLAMSDILPPAHMHDLRTMGSEDMSLFMSDIPGMYFFVGAHVEGRDLNWGHHHPRFDFDENALPLGVALLTAAVASYVLPD